jgi:hypothetical protein
MKNKQIEILSFNDDFFYFVKHKKKKKKKKKKGTSRIKPVGIFQRPKKAGAQCFSCTTRTYKSYIHHHI